MLLETFVTLKKVILIHNGFVSEAQELEYINLIYKPKS